MTSEEWDRDVQDKYAKMLRAINIPSEVSTTEIKILIARLDEVLTDLIVDYPQEKSAYEAAERREKAFVKERFVALKTSGQRMTEKEIDGRCVMGPEYELIKSTTDETRRRYNYLQFVVDLIKNKKEMLNQDRDILRLEANIQ
jgi:hypothetical protein